MTYNAGIANHHEGSCAVPSKPARRTACSREAAIYRFAHRIYAAYKFEHRLGLQLILADMAPMSAFAAYQKLIAEHGETRLRRLAFVRGWRQESDVARLLLPGWTGFDAHVKRRSRMTEAERRATYVRERDE